MPDLLVKLRDVFADRKLLPKGVVVVAVSGGIDSMVLLHLLSSLKNRFGWTLHVAHFNHRLRGRASAEDERFVRRQAERFGLEFQCARWDEKEKNKLVKKYGVEMAARDVRLRFLGETARVVKSKNVVLAHHADDQAELFFIRLLRGSSSQGLSGMREKVYMKAPVSCSLIRPLLGFSRNQLINWAKENGVRHREDESNADVRFLRNRVRQELIPLLESGYSVGIASRLSQTMRLLADEADWMRAEAGRALEDSRLRFARLPVALQRQVLVIQLEKLNVEFDFDAVEKIRCSIGSVVNVRGDRLVSVSENGRVAEHEKESLSFGDDRVRVEFAGRQGRVEFGGHSFSWTIKSTYPKAKARGGAHREIFDLEHLGSSVTLRRWRAGDRFQPIGMALASKLQNLFTNAKISSTKRRNCIVAETEDGEIFWVEGLRIGECAKVTSETRKYLEWTWVNCSENG